MEISPTRDSRRRRPFGALARGLSGTLKVRKPDHATFNVAAGEGVLPPFRTPGLSRRCRSSGQAGYAAPRAPSMAGPWLSASLWPPPGSPRQSTPPSTRKVAAPGVSPSALLLKAWLRPLVVGLSPFLGISGGGWATTHGCGAESNSGSRPWRRWTGRSRRPAIVDATWGVTLREIDGERFVVACRPKRWTIRPGRSAISLP